MSSAVVFMNRSAFYIGAALISIFCLVYTMLQHHTGKPNNRIFILGLVNLLITATCDSLFYYYRPYAPYNDAARIVYLTSNYIYFVMHSLLSMFMLFYAMFATQNFERTSWRRLFVYLFPCAISELLVITNPFTGWVYHFDSELNFVRGPAEAAIYIAGAIYLVQTIWVFLFRWNGLTRRTRIILIVSFFIMVLCIGLQVMYPDMQIELFGEAIAFMGLMIAIEYDDEWMDATTGVCNRNALLRDLRNQFDQKTPFSAICIRLLNYDATRRILNKNENEIAVPFADELKKIHYYYDIYRVMPDSYVMIMRRRNSVHFEKIKSEVIERLKDGYKYNDTWIPIRSMIIAAEYPERIKSIEDLLTICEGDFDFETGEEGMLSEHELDRMLAQSKMERLLHEGMAQKSLEIYYQPAYDAQTHKIDSAEALIRYEDFGEDVFMPHDFIKVAEKNGSIMELGDYILNEVCSFLESGVPERIGINYINVNLSVLQCMSPDFEKRVLKILGHYPDVKPSMINFEIMDTISARDYEDISSAIIRLKNAGFKFSMEGYGMGYSNMYSIFALDFDMIKIDKTLLWDADKSKEGRIILENSIKMVHNTGSIVTLVGIESKEQMDMIKNLPVDRLQGFYLSMPMTRSEIEGGNLNA